MVKANNPSSLKEFSGKLELTDQWGRDLLEPMEWNKCKGELEKLNHCHNSSQKKKKKLHSKEQYLLLLSNMTFPLS